MNKKEVNQLTILTSTVVLCIVSFALTEGEQYMLLTLVVVSLLLNLILISNQ